MHNIEVKKQRQNPPPTPPKTNNNNKTPTHNIRFKLNNHLNVYKLNSNKVIKKEIEAF